MREVNILDFEENVGRKIKQFRKEFLISQKDLAAGICTQAFISKIEKGEAHPTAYLVYRISQRLGVKVDDLFSNPDIVFYSEHVINQIKESISRYEYKDAYKMIAIEKNHPYLQARKIKQTLTWLEAICLYRLKGEYESAKRLLNEAIDSDRAKKGNLSESEIEMLITLGNIYSEEKIYEESLGAYKKAERACKGSLARREVNHLPSRIYYNMSKVYFKKQKFDQCVTIAGQGIQYSFKHETTHCLGELYFQRGEGYAYLKEPQNALADWENAIWLFEQSGSLDAFEYVQKQYDLLKGDQYLFNFQDMN